MKWIIPIILFLMIPVPHAGAVTSVPQDKYIYNIGSLSYNNVTKIVDADNNTRDVYTSTPEWATTNYTEYYDNQTKAYVGYTDRTNVSLYTLRWSQYNFTSGVSGQIRQTERGITKNGTLRLLSYLPVNFRGMRDYFVVEKNVTLSSYYYTVDINLVNRTGWINRTNSDGERIYITLYANGTNIINRDGNISRRVFTFDNSTVIRYHLWYSSRIQQLVNVTREVILPKVNTTLSLNSIPSPPYVSPMGVVTETRQLIDYIIDENFYSKNPTVSSTTYETQHEATLTTTVATPLYISYISLIIAIVIMKKNSKIRLYRINT